MEKILKNTASRFAKICIVTFAILLFSLAFFNLAQAAPAMPEPVPFRQADGTYVMVQAMGDEFFNWQECEEGYVIAFGHDTQNWYYAVSMTRSGVAMPGAQVVGEEAPLLARGLGGRRITSDSADFVELAEEVSQQRKIELGAYQPAPVGPLRAASFEGHTSTGPAPHISTNTNDIITRPYQPLLMMVLEWNNVMLNPQRTSDNTSWSSDPADWSYAQMFNGNAHAFWQTRAFGTAELMGGSDMAAQLRNSRTLNSDVSASQLAALAMGGTYHNSQAITGFEGLTMNNWIDEASGGQFQFVRPDGMGLDGLWDGYGSVNYFNEEVTNAIRTQGYFHADRQVLRSLGVNDVWFIHIEHGVVSVRLDSGHPGYNINTNPALGGSANSAFNAVRHFIDWSQVPRMGGTGPNRYDVLAQDLNLYYIYTGFEGSLGGNAAWPAFWGHASVTPMRQNVVRDPVVVNGVVLDEGIGPRVLGSGPNAGPVAPGNPTGIPSTDITGARRLVSAVFPQAGGPNGLPTRGAYGSHGEQSHPDIAQGLGIFIHELGHSVWGLADKAVGGAAGSAELCVGFWCGMGRGTWGAFRYRDYNVRLGTAGTHFRATFATQLGWMTPMTLQSDDVWSGEIGHWSDEAGRFPGGRTIRHWDSTVHSVENGDIPMAVMLTATDAMNLDIDGWRLDTHHVQNHHQFFIVENFQHVGFDRSASLEVWNRGIMVWHVDTRTNAGATESGGRAPNNGGVNANNNSHRRFNLKGVMIPNQGVVGGMIHSGWFADPFFLPGEVFGRCPIEAHGVRGWCDPECSVRFVDNVHTAISNFHAPNNVPVPWGTHRGLTTFPATTPGHTGATHPDSHPQIVPTGIDMRVIGPGGSGRTGHGPTRSNPTNFTPWVVVPRISVEFGSQAGLNDFVTISPTEGDYIEFPGVDFGYSAEQLPGAQTFRVRNTSEEVVTNLNVSLLSDGPGRGPGYSADIRAFTLGLVGNPQGVSLVNNTAGAGAANAVTGAIIESLAPGAFVDFTIRPLIGLDVAVHFDLEEDGRGGLAIEQQHVGGFHAARLEPHSASVMLTGLGGINDSFGVSFMVSPIDNVTFADLVPGTYNNATGPRSVQFFTGENWPGARADDAVPFLEWDDTGMPKTWVPLVGTFDCGDTPTVRVPIMVGAPGAARFRDFELSSPILCGDCDGVVLCNNTVTFAPLPGGLAIHPDNHWFGGHLWGRPNRTTPICGDTGEHLPVTVAFYLRHMSDYAHDIFGGDIGLFDITVTRGDIAPPTFVLNQDGHTLNWFRTITAHTLLGTGNNAAGRDALATSAYRIYVDGAPFMVDDEYFDIPAGTEFPLVMRSFDLRTLGLEPEYSGQVFEINMRGIVSNEHRHNWGDSSLYHLPVFFATPELCDDCDEYPCECPEACDECDAYPCECPEVCDVCDEYPCECPEVCDECDAYPCECPEVCDECDEYPCECPEVCDECDEYPCECPEVCDECDEYPCECPEVCDECDKYPCECLEVCEECDEYPCDCDDVQTHRWHPSLPQNRFADVQNYPHWQNNPVSWADRNGITQGIAGTTPLEFRPNNPTTREMFATFMHRIADLPDAEETSNFVDSDTISDWAADAVNWAAENGVIEGFTDGTFRPNENITREQIALMLFRYAEIIGVDTEFSVQAFNTFSDCNLVSDWAIDAMRWATHHRIIIGQDGSMAPCSNATRAETVTMLQRFVDTFDAPPPSWVDYTG